MIYTVKEVPRQTLGPRFGLHLRHEKTILIREDLPSIAKTAILVHEFEHAKQPRNMNIYVKEVLAITHTFWKPLIGNIVIIIMSLTPKRLKFYWRKYVRREKI